MAVTLNFDDLLIGRKLGNCLIQSRIGKGGMATVYRAIRDGDEAVVAIKVIAPQFSSHEEFLHRFEREAQLMLSLSHPNILPVYDYGKEGDVTYLVMRLLDGGSLADVVVARHDPLLQSTTYIEQICSALDHAHAKGVIHRDLKPANILLDQAGNLYLTDFGIAKWRDETHGLTLTGMVIGTPAYMAPEQWRTEPVDARTDIYALGVMLFEVMTGQLPFQAQTPFSLMYKHLDEPPPFASKLNPDLPLYVDSVLQRAMDKLPERRYPSAGLFGAALQEAFLARATAVTLVEPLSEAVTYATTSLGVDRGTYNALEVGVQSLLSKAREVARETQGEMAVLAEAVIHYIQALSDQAKHMPTGGPYKALESYDLADNKLFFGRETAIDAMLARAPFAKFTVLHAESGAGKTSLIRAGLMPRLLAGGFLPIYVAVRRRLPHEAVKHALMPNESALTGSSLHTYLKGIAQTVGEKREIFLFFDQFETFFTDVFTDEERATFVSQLAECLDDSSLQVRVTLAMRTEYFGLLASFQPAIPQPFDKEFLLRRLKLEEAERALLGPAEEHGFTYEQGLVSELLADLADEKGEVAPPQLQLVGTALIDRLPLGRKQVIREDYEQAGGAKGVLRRYLETLLERLPSNYRRPARLIIESLVRADQTRDVRTVDSIRGDLKALGVATADIESIVTILHENHVLRMVDTDAGVAYELVHDYLAEQVQVDPETVARKAAQELLEQRERAYQDYGALLTREELEIIKAQQKQLVLQGRAQELITRTEQAFRRQRRRIVGLTMASVFGVVGILALGLLAAIRESANRQQRLENAQTAEARISAERDVSRSTESRRLADLAEQQLTIDPMTSLNLALAALTPLDRPYVAEAEFALNQALLGIQERVYMPSEQRVNGAVWSADERQVLTWSVDRTARLFDARTGEELMRLDDQTSAVLVVAWSPDERQIATGDSNGGLYVYDAITGELQWQVTAHNGRVNGIAWGAERIITWSDDGFTGLWILTGESVAMLEGTPAYVNHRGTQVATVNRDNAIIIWDASDGRRLGELRGHVNRISGATWNGDDTQLLTWSADFNAIVWDVKTMTPLYTLAGVHENAVNTAAWSPDERWIITGGSDGRLVLWQDGQAIWQQQTVGAFIDGVNWSSDGQRVLVFGTSEVLGIWDIQGVLMSDLMNGVARVTTPFNLRHLPKVETHNVLFSEYEAGTTIRNALWSPDEKAVLTYSRDGVIRVFDAVTGGLEVGLIGHNADIQSAQWSQDSQFVLSSGQDGAARIWDVYNNLIIEQRWFADAGRALAASWNEDESRVAVGYENGLVWIWRVEAAEPIILRGHHNQVTSVVWSPDSRRLLTGSDDGQAIVWDVVTGTALVSVAHEWPLNGAIWNAAGTQMLTFSDDGSVRVWDANSGIELMRFQMSEPGIGVGSALWNQDETQVLATSDNGLMQVWDTQTGTIVLSVQTGEVPALGARWNQGETRLLVWGAKTGLDAMARVYDAATGEMLLDLEGHREWIVSASWDAAEQRILTTSRDGTARIWDARTGAMLMALEGHSDNVTDGQWNQDGTRVLTRSVDGTARVWHVATGQEIQRLSHAERVRVATWDTDESSILTASDDGVVVVWRTRALDDLISMATEYATHALTSAQRDAFFMPISE
ncbi:MAG: protein kinase [Anaerolineales bacterium]|nr:protein kinase [Anaerolineales bacterium]